VQQSWPEQSKPAPCSGKITQHSRSVPRLSLPCPDAAHPGPSRSSGFSGLSGAARVVERERGYLRLLGQGPGPARPNWDGRFPSFHDETGLGWRVAGLVG
jgi:hypothetical protein